MERLTLTAYNNGIRFQQTFFCKKAYNNRVKELRSIGFVVMLVH